SGRLLHQPRVDLGDRVGDRLPVLAADLVALLDLNAARAPGRDPVDHVVGRAAAERVALAGDRHLATDRGLDLLLQQLLDMVRTAAADQHPCRAHAVERDRIGEVALADAGEPGEALGVDRRAGHVPAIPGSAAALVALAAPGAD